MLSKQTPKQPSYQPPEDPNYKCNFDRVLEALTIRVSGEELKGLRLKDFFGFFMSVSVFGARVELLNEQTLQPEVYTFLPTLSSIFLSYSRICRKRSTVVKKLTFDDVEGPTSLIAQEVEIKKPDISESRETRIFEHHEREPHFLRKPLCSKVADLVRDNSALENLLLTEEEFDFNGSWFALLWTCQRVCKPCLSGLEGAVSNDSSADNSTQITAT